MSAAVSAKEGSQQRSSPTYTSRFLSCPSFVIPAGRQLGPVPNGLEMSRATPDSFMPSPTASSP